MIHSPWDQPKKAKPKRKAKKKAKQARKPAPRKTAARKKAKKAKGPPPRPKRKPRKKVTKKRRWKKLKARQLDPAEPTPRATGKVFQRVSEMVDLFGAREDRWRLGQRYQALPTTFHPDEYEVIAGLDRDVTKGFVLTHHYAQTYPRSAHISGKNYGLYHKPTRQLVGVAAYGQPGGPKVLESSFPNLEDLGKTTYDPDTGEWYATPITLGQAATELQRLVLLDAVPYGGEVWFVTKTFDHLKGKKGIRGVVSFSDPWYGHVGGIYKAASGFYTGTSRAEPVWRYKDTGFQVPRRIVTKLQAADKVWAGCHGSGKSIGGWEADIRTLVSHGAPQPVRGACLRDWLDAILPMIAEKVPHPGKHRYVWGLTRGQRADLEKRLVDPRNYPIVCAKCDTLFYTDELEELRAHARECRGLRGIRAVRKKANPWDWPSDSWGWR
jgi:hypothetical protein